jgi:hypothetical protein
MRLGPLWPPGSHALATAAAEAISSMVVESRRTFSCFVGPADVLAGRYRAAALPVRLGADGAIRMELPELDPRNRVVLDSALGA